MREYTANANDEGVRLSRFVERVTRGLPQSQLYKAFRNKRIKVNGKRGAPDTRLQSGDLVQLYINDEFFPGACPAETIARVPYEVVWQDEKLAVLYKPQGVLSHSDQKGAANLLGSFTEDMIKKGEYSLSAANGFAPALCNRLDRGTEGLVLAAKRYDALRDTNTLIHDGIITKQYLCITAGTPPTGVHNAHHKRDMQAKTVHITKRPAPGTKPISTEVEVVEKYEGLCLCRVTLHTGRTHQIRAHLAHLGTPIVGDRKYGGQAGSYGWQTQALCAHSLLIGTDIPQGNAMAYLAGRRFTAKHGKVESWWRNFIAE